MKKKLISAVLAAAIALSLSAEAFAAAATNDGSEQEMKIPTMIATPTINVEWPTLAGVVFNPYKMAIKVTTSADGKLDVTESDESGATTTDTLYSPAMTVTNRSATALKVTVAGSVKNQSNIDPKTKLPNKDDDGDGDADYKDATNITFSTTALKQPSYDKNGKLIAGDTKNTVLLYLEVLEKDADSGEWTAAAAYDAKNANQMIYSTKEVKKDLFTVPARESVTKGTEVKIQFRGDVTTQPTNWADLSKTEKIVIATTFKAVPVAPDPEKPATT